MGMGQREITRAVGFFPFSEPVFTGFLTQNRWKKPVFLLTIEGQAKSAIGHFFRAKFPAFLLHY